MSIKIDTSLCIGCGKCVEACPGNLLTLTGEKNKPGTKAQILIKEDCWGCCSCLKECPKHAISFFLGADMGGRGSVMHYAKERGLVIWTITKTDGSEEKIVIDPKNANKY